MKVVDVVLHPRRQGWVWFSPAFPNSLSIVGAQHAAAGNMDLEKKIDK